MLAWVGGSFSSCRKQRATPLLCSCTGWNPRSSYPLGLVLGTETGQLGSKPTTERPVKFDPVSHGLFWDRFARNPSAQHSASCPRV